MLYLRLWWYADTISSATIREYGTEAHGPCRTLLVLQRKKSQHHQNIFAKLFLNLGDLQSINHTDFGIFSCDIDWCASHPNFVPTTIWWCQTIKCSSHPGSLQVLLQHSNLINAFIYGQTLVCIVIVILALDASIHLRALLKTGLTSQTVVITGPFQHCALCALVLLDAFISHLYVTISINSRLVILLHSIPLMFSKTKSLSVYLSSITLLTDHLHFQVISLLLH